MIKKSKYIQGLYKPINPKKYNGDITNIVYRSSWEKRFFHWCDENSAIISWSSEEVIVPYFHYIDKKYHRYFVDARITIQDINGNLETFLVEIKPYAQTQKPKYPGKTTKRYLTEVQTYVKNRSKWAAAEQYAKDRGMKFIILTEHHLGITK